MEKNKFFITQKEAVKHIGRDPRTLRRWVKAGYLKVENGQYSREQLDVCKRLYDKKKSRHLKIRIREIENLKDKIEALITELSDIKLKLEQILS